MLSDEDARMIEAAAVTADRAALRQWVLALLHDRRERIDAAELVRQRLKPFAYFRDLIKSA